MKQEVTWEVSGGGEQSPPIAKKKLAFVIPIDILDAMDNNTKKFYTTYNNMQKELIKQGLMESK
jgi:hypothetical protein